MSTVTVDVQCLFDNRHDLTDFSYKHHRYTVEEYVIPCFCMILRERKFKFRLRDQFHKCKQHHMINEYNKQFLIRRDLNYALEQEATEGSFNMI